MNNIKTIAFMLVANCVSCQSLTNKKQEDPNIYLGEDQQIMVHFPVSTGRKTLGLISERDGIYQIFIYNNGKCIHDWSMPPDGKGKIGPTDAQVDKLVELYEARWNNGKPESEGRSFAEPGAEEQ